MGAGGRARRPGVVAVLDGLWWGVVVAGVLLIAASAAAVLVPGTWVAQDWIASAAVALACVVAGSRATASAGGAVVLHGGVTGLVLAALTAGAASAVTGIGPSPAQTGLRILLGAAAGVLGGILAPAPADLGGRP